MRLLLTFSLAIFLLSLPHAELATEEKKNINVELPRIPARSPEESAKQFEIHPAFRIELAAAEPLVMSPVAAEFDEDGRLFVVEAPEYNQSGSTKPHGKGRVVMLEDTDGDGKFDKRTVVVDHLDYPTAVFPWKGGLFIGAAPHLYYCKDGQTTVILSGFGSDKAGEGQLNSFRWTLENRLLISTGTDGGDIIRQRDKEPMPINVRRQNILLNPVRKNEFEATSGGGQHGLTLDDWGNTFVCGNSDPCHHLVYDARYLKQNPALIAPPPSINIAPGGKFTKLHRISEIEPWRIMRTKLRKEGAIPGSDEGGQPSGFFTGATGITVYRGDAFPAEFKGNVFVGEVANNLVFRAKLVPKGVTFVAERADRDKEFLASKDVWFRPVQFIQGPDGCLYVIDMYRELIEGAAFLAPPILKNVDASAGVDKGRIWRIAPKDFKQPKPTKLSTASFEELIKLLDHPNGWHRDTASRLLFQPAELHEQRLFPEFIAKAKTPQGRIHALYLLANNNVDPEPTITPFLRDPNPQVRRHAIHILAGIDMGGISEKDVLQLVRDDDPMVRYELAWAMGASENVYAEGALQALVKRDLADPWMRLAIAFAATRGNSYQYGRLDFISDPEVRKTPEGRAFIELLVETAGAREDRYVALAALRGITRLREDDVGFQFHLLSVLTRRASEQTMKYLQKNEDARKLYAQLRERAEEIAVEPKATEAERASAIRALGIVPYEELRGLIADALKPSHPKAVQLAALELLARSGAAETPAVLLKAWPSLSPGVRPTATEIFLSRANWVNAFLDAVEEKKISRADIDPARIALLLKSPSRAVRVRVEELFGARVSNRKEIVDRYQPALTMKGDALKGKVIFKKDCSACHKLEGVGEEVGADLKAIRDRGLEGMLLNILDPNREVKPQFLTYQLETTNGKTLSGMLIAETPNSVTMRLLDGRSETVTRASIDSLRSTGLSFMPEGMEKQIDVAAMADLLAYLNSIK